MWAGGVIARREARLTARRIIKALQGYGNFDEFNDHRERDGINREAIDLIAEEILVYEDRREQQGEKP